MGTRPAYEQLSDREIQGEVAAEIEEAWDCEVIPLPQYSACDYLFVSRVTLNLALGELKHRKNHREQYPALILSVAKLSKITMAAEALQIPFFLFVQWADGLFWRRVSAVDLPDLTCKRSGRKDRNDMADIETVYELPIATFRPLRKAFWQMEEPAETPMQ